MDYKNILRLFLTASVITATVLGCSSPGMVSQDENKEINSNDTWTLKDHLRRKPGVRVMGTGSSTRILIRGESSTANATNQPLFIVDGQKAGHSFSSVNDMLYPGEIKSVEVVPPSKAARYGMEGHYGVILIYTKLDQH